MTEDELPVGVIHDEDIQTFRDKLANATTEEQANKIQCQIELLKDSIIIYQLRR
jgi:hypothetical protein